MKKEKCYVEDIYDDDHELIGFVFHKSKFKYPIGCSKFEGKDKHGHSFSELRNIYGDMAIESNKLLIEDAEGQKQMEAWMKETGYVEPTYEEILERYKAVKYDK